MEADDWRQQAVAKYKLIEEWEKEEESHSEKAKACRKRIAAAEAEIRKIVLGGAQISIPTTSADPDAPVEPPCTTPDSYHDWQRIRETNGLLLEDCSRCGLERTGAPGEPHNWIFTRPTEKAEEAAAVGADSAE